MTADVGATSPELPPFGTAERCAKCTCPDIDDRYQDHTGIKPVRDGQPHDFTAGA